ncbi:MAG TPA: hypothetical protein VFX70_14120 [Mycobacteriales bacterium]|nr:hypothetical protein [Mycobacteriales bacterium]
MRLLLAVGLDETATSRAFDLLRDAGPARLRTVPAAPSRSDLDGALDTLGAAGEDTLVIAAGDAGLNTVVTRLLRRGGSADLPVAVLPAGGSAVGRWLGLPAGTDAAVGVALTGTPTRCGLVRDDHGGVLLASATLTPWQGRRFGTRAYLDDTEIANRMIRELAVRPGDGCLHATVTAGRLAGPSRSRAGRAVTVSCEPARLVVDGGPHPRPQTRRTWWYQPDLWQVVLPG